MFCDVSWPLIKGQLETYDNGAARDIMVGSSIINDLNAFQTPIPVVNVWGSEYSPVHWRQFESALFTKPETLPLNVTDDEGLMNTMDGIANFYEVTSIVSGSSALALTIAGFFAPPAWAYVAPFANLGVQTYQGYYWIAKESEVQWCTVIGATNNTSTNITTQDFSCFEQLIVNGISWVTSLSMNDIGNCFRTNTITYQVPTMLPNDGIVSKNHALMPGVCDIAVEGANHQELRNHPNATRAYNDIFLAQDCVHPFFHTP